ncbi:uncharacterized protein LOC111696549 [Eurytemora carolleeae]|uniref:uncharacterized protein LOC111696549 n=1 Tax=Eurytemora carolleeae TaxID=1294199 RepID=UPI000C76651B|nr:uncharacterized protein LOC111696549 [Eurytemora carolleeae]|eukprot:XP_023321946.1 uncharacterized protein LOC111696549 [Eurytemora affinis]
MPASGGGVLTSEYGPGPIPGPSPESSPSPGSGPSPSSGPSSLLPVPIDVWRVNTVPNIQETVKGPTGASSNISLERASNSAKMRIIKLEKSLVWLQQQHRQMLADLFNEIETMKNKNRELQFQLLMSGVDPDTLKQTEIKISRQVMVLHNLLSSLAKP